MRNEAKSIEIASKFADGYGIDFEPLAEAALDMAEWKDHQFKEYLEKKKAELVTQIKHSTGECFPYVMYMTMVDKIINELFKEN